MIVMFDLCDGDFRFYNSYEWSKKIARWRRNMSEEIDDADVSVLDDEEVFDMIHGDECWYAEVPTDI